MPSHVFLSFFGVCPGDDSPVVTLFRNRSQPLAAAILRVAFLDAGELLEGSDRPAAASNAVGTSVAGGSIDDNVLAALAEAASAACDPSDDKRGTIAYRRQVAGVLAKRAAVIAVERAQNGV